VPPARIGERGESIVAVTSASTDAENGYVLVAGDFEGEFSLEFFNISRTPPDRYGLLPTPAMPTENDPGALALYVIDEANCIWAAAIAKDRGGFASALELRLAGAWLTKVRSDVDAMHARGQYREARQTAPTVVRSARRLPDGRIEAYVVEQWDDRLFDRTGSVIQTFPSRVEQRYVLERREVHGKPGWFIVESELTRS
jgi:hypothetical protein